MSHVQYYTIYSFFIYSNNDSKFPKEEKCELVVSNLHKRLEGQLSRQWSKAMGHFRAALCPEAKPLLWQWVYMNETERLFTGSRFKTRLTTTLGDYLTIILRNRTEYHLILSRRRRRPSWLNQGIFRKVEQANWFIIQQIFIVYHFHIKKTSAVW